MYGCVQFTASAVLFLFMLCKTDDKAESERYWAGLMAAAIQQAELAARVCAQCLFTAGGKDPAGIGCHSPHSALQKGKGVWPSTFLLSHSPSAHAPPAEHCLGCKGENGVPGLMLQATGGWRTGARRQEQPWLQPHCSLARKVGWIQGDTWAALQGKREWDGCTWLLREMGTLKATNGHGCSCAGTVLWYSLRAGYKTQACVETHLLSDPSDFWKHSPSGGKTC